MKPITKRISPERRWWRWFGCGVGGAFNNNMYYACSNKYRAFILLYYGKIFIAFMNSNREEIKKGTFAFALPTFFNWTMLCNVVAAIVLVKPVPRVISSSWAKLKNIFQKSSSSFSLFENDSRQTTDDKKLFLQQLHQSTSSTNYRINNKKLTSRVVDRYGFWVCAPITIFHLWCNKVATFVAMCTKKIILISTGSISLLYLSSWAVRQIFKKKHAWLCPSFEYDSFDPIIH